jgi:hypothetical protein
MLESIWLTIKILIGIIVILTLSIVIVSMIKEIVEEIFKKN